MLIINRLLDRPRGPVLLHTAEHRHQVLTDVDSKHDQTLAAGTNRRMTRRGQQVCEGVDKPQQQALRGVDSGVEGLCFCALWTNSGSWH